MPYLASIVLHSTSRRLGLLLGLTALGLLLSGAEIWLARHGAGGDAEAGRLLRLALLCDLAAMGFLTVWLVRSVRRSLAMAVTEPDRAAEFSARPVGQGKATWMAAQPDDKALRILKAAVATAQDGIAIASPEGGLTYVNPAFLRLWGYREESEVLGRSALSFWEKPEEAEQVVRAIVAQGSWSGQLVARLAGGGRADVELHAHVVRDADGRMLALMASFFDVSEKKRVELTLSRSERRLRQAQHMAQIGNWELDHESGRLWWSEEIYRMFALSPAEFAPSYEGFLGAIHPEDRDRVNAAFQRSLQERIPYAIIHRLRLPDGSIRYVEERCETEFGADGRPRISFGTVQEVTARVQIEQELRDSLREKETLLREVHHRVKNNLQVISSLVHLERRRITSAEDLTALDGIGRRLRAISLVHEKLYQARDLSRIDLGGYLRSLVTEVKAAQLVRIGVAIEIDTEPVVMPIEVAMPCGLLTSELVINALKHGFPDGRTGRVRVELKAVADRCHLTVADDGVGLPAEQDLEQTEGFGWQLVCRLAEQLAADLEIHRDNGTRVVVTFQISPGIAPLVGSGPSA